MSPERGPIHRQQRKARWWNLRARYRRYKRKKALTELTRESQNWPGGYR